MSDMRIVKNILEASWLSCELISVANQGLIMSVLYDNSLYSHQRQFCGKNDEILNDD